MRCAALHNADLATIRADDADIPIFVNDALVDQRAGFWPDIPAKPFYLLSPRVVVMIYSWTL